MRYRVAVSKFKKEYQDELRELQNVVEKTKFTSIKRLGENFIEGLTDIRFMFQLPNIVLMHSIVHSEALIEGLEVCSKYAQDGDIEAVDTETLLGELRDKLAKNPLIKDRKIEDRYKQLATPVGVLWSDVELERILRLHMQHGRSYYNLLYSGIVWVWTLFEVFAADLWETTLNTGFNILGKSALKRMAKMDALTAFEDKMRGKSIKVDYLAEFDYNIKDNVGSILKRYFDFSSLSGIKNAYKFVFPKSVTLEKSLGNDTLRLLSEDRNLIVHKAGYIDAKYKSMTNTTQNVGDKLLIDGEICEGYETTVLKVFRYMLNCANRYLKLDSELSES